MNDNKSDIDFDEEVIVRDSIIKNKERTKIYWEQLMMAAATENQSNIKKRPWDVNENHSNPPSNRNSVSSAGDTEDNLSNHKDDSIDVNDKETEMEIDLRNVKDEKRRIEREIRLQKDRQLGDSGYGIMRMEDKIALELEEMRAREEELKQLRNKLLSETNKEPSSPTPKETIIANGIDELNSLHTTDDGNYSEYGSEEKEHSLDGSNSRVNTPYSEPFMHRRTQSLDSVSSGHSSGSGSTLNDRDAGSRRRVLVRPYEDPEEDETPAFRRNEKETPIEREIRLAKEREEELRREKGVFINDKHSESESHKIHSKSMNKKDALENDTRGVQHRLATNRIQQEIEEATERENELRTEGKILTTSEETVDAKVTRFTQIAESAIMEHRYRDPKMKRSSSMSQLVVSVNNEEKPRNASAPIKTYIPQVNRRFAPNPAQKGIMQRFIATKGQLPMTTMNNNNPKYTNHVYKPMARRSNPVSAEVVVPARKGYTPVGEKIQEELKEMKKREEELRLQRARSFDVMARSQPDLSDITQGEEELHSWTSHKENSKTDEPFLSHSVSNPNLLDDKDDSLEKMNKRTSRKRFSLLQEWENRIQSIQQEV